MVIRAGLEPRITALKGLCPYHLDERTRFTGSFLPALGIGCNKNIINAHTEECCKNDQIIDSRERSSTLPLVNRLRGMEPKDNLYVSTESPADFRSLTILAPVSARSMVGLFIIYTSCSE